MKRATLFLLALAACSDDPSAPPSDFGLAGGWCVIDDSTVYRYEEPGYRLTVQPVGDTYCLTFTHDWTVSPSDVPYNITIVEAWGDTTFRFSAGYFQLPAVPGRYRLAGDSLRFDWGGAHPFFTRRLGHTRPDSTGRWMSADSLWFDASRSELAQFVWARADSGASASARLSLPPTSGRTLPGGALARWPKLWERKP